MAQENPEVKAGFTLGEVLNIAKPGEQRQTRTFTAAGRDWTITIGTEGKTHAEVFYDLITLSQQAAMECGGIPGMPMPENPGLEVSLPEHDAKPIRIKNAGYLAQIYVLSAVAIEPKFTPEEWAIFGHKIKSPSVFEEILDWASNENGVGQWLYGQLEKIKNALGGAGQFGTGSGTPASPIANKPRKSRSKVGAQSPS